VYERACRSPEFLAQPWDVSRGDLLLALSPSASVEDVPTRAAGPHCINVSLGASTVPGFRRVADALVTRESQRQERQPRWRVIFEVRQFHRLLVHLDAQPGSSRTVSRPRRSRDGYLEVNVRWEPTATTRSVPAFAREVLDAVANKLEEA
jgi:hypothetical protein